MSLIPINDVVKVEVATDQYGFGGDEKAGVESGIVTDFPDMMPYLSFHSFAFENSIFNDELKGLAESYKQTLVGKRVYWKSYAERGMVFEEKDTNKRWAFVKLTDILAYSDDVDNIAYTVGTGTFSP